MVNRKIVIQDTLDKILDYDEHPIIEGKVLFSTDTGMRFYDKAGERLLALSLNSIEKEKTDYEYINSQLNLIKGSLNIVKNGLVAKLVYVDSDGLLYEFGQTDAEESSILSLISVEKIDNWNMAYSWGNHATQGYLKTSDVTLDSVTDTGSTTSNPITVGGIGVGAGNITWTITDEDTTSLGDLTFKKGDNKMVIKDNGVYFNDVQLGVGSGTITSVALDNGTNQGTVKLIVNGVATADTQVTSLAVTSTPTFAGVALGEGPETWTIDDTTTDQLRFSHDGAGTAILPKVSSGTRIIAFTDEIQGIINGDVVVGEADYASKAAAAPVPIGRSLVGSSIDLTSIDANKYIRINSYGSGVTLNLSLTSSNLMAIGDEIHICSQTPDDVTIAVGSGLSLYSLDSKKKIAGQYGVVTLKKITSTQWHLFGALK